MWLLTNGSINQTQDQVWPESIAPSSWCTSTASQHRVQQQCQETMAQSWATNGCSVAWSGALTSSYTLVNWLAFINPSLIKAYVVNFTNVKTPQGNTTGCGVSRCSEVDGKLWWICGGDVVDLWWGCGGFVVIFNKRFVRLVVVSWAGTCGEFQRTCSDIYSEFYAHKTSQISGDFHHIYAKVGINIIGVLNYKYTL